MAEVDPKLNDRRGFYIIRVIERKAAWRTPFSEAQEELAKEIKEKRLKEKQAAYIEKIFAEMPPWTVYDARNPKPRPPDAKARYQR